MKALFHNSRFNRVLLSLYLVLLGYVVFTPAPAQTRFLFSLQISWLMEKVLNFFLLMPLPILVFWVKREMKTSSLFLLGPIVSAAIETVQRWIPGRFSTWSDFLLNSSGAILIALLVRQSRLRQSQR